MTYALITPPTASNQPVVSSALIVRAERAGPLTGLTATSRYRLRSPRASGRMPIPGWRSLVKSVIGEATLIRASSAVR